MKNEAKYNTVSAPDGASSGTRSPARRWVRGFLAHQIEAGNILVVKNVVADTASARPEEKENVFEIVKEGVW